MNIYLIKLDLNNKDAKYIWSLAHKCYIDEIVGINNEGIDIQANSSREAVEVLCLLPKKYAPNFRGGWPLRQDIWTAELKQNIKRSTLTSKSDGMFCSRCTEFSPMAEPNIPDGKFKCFSCRKYAYR